MTKIFSNSSSKIPKSGIFCPKFKDFYFSHQALRALIANMTMVFQNCCPKHPNEAFLVPNLRILFLARNFAVRKIGGRWLQI